VIKLGISYLTTSALFGVYHLFIGYGHEMIDITHEVIQQDEKQYL
jgi:hypothetical protein